MEPMVLVASGGILGANGRYLTGVVLDSRPATTATLTVNALGSFLLGLFIFGGAGDSLLLFVGVGFCGAFTTFSSFSFQTVDLWREGRPGYAIVYAIGNLLLASIAVLLAGLLIAVG